METVAKKLEENELRRTAIRADPWVFEYVTGNQGQNNPYVAFVITIQYMEVKAWKMKKALGGKNGSFKMVLWRKTLLIPRTRKKYKGISDQIKTEFSPKGKETDEWTDEKFSEDTWWGRVCVGSATWVIS